MKSGLEVWQVLRGSQPLWIQAVPIMHTDVTSICRRHRVTSLLTASLYILKIGCADSASRALADNGLHCTDKPIDATPMFKTASQGAHTQQKRFSRSLKHDEWNAEKNRDWREEHNLKTFAATNAHNNSSGHIEGAPERQPRPDQAPRLHDTLSSQEISRKENQKQEVSSNSENVSQNNSAPSEASKSSREGSQSQDKVFKAWTMSWPADWGIKVENEEAGAHQTAPARVFLLVRVGIPCAVWECGPENLLILWDVLNSTINHEHTG
jgi:hypothetical protein